MPTNIATCIHVSAGALPPRLWRANLRLNCDADSPIEIDFHRSEDMRNSYQVDHTEGSCILGLALEFHAKSVGVLHEFYWHNPRPPEPGRK